MKWKRSAAFLIVALSVAWIATTVLLHDGWQVVEIDASQPVAIHMKPRYPLIQLTEVSGIRIDVDGDIDGEAFIEASTFKTKRVGGQFRDGWVGDYFGEYCDFKYIPRGKVTGRLKVKYKLH